MTTGGMATDEADTGVADPEIVRRLLAYARPYSTAVTVAILLLLVEAGLALVAPTLTRRAIDVAIPAHDGAMLVTLGALFIATLFASFAEEYAQALLTTWVGQRVMSDLRRQLFAHLQRLSVPFFDRQPVGRLVTRVTSDVETLNELFSSGVVTVVGDVATLLAISGLMLAMNWRLALVSFAVLPFMGIVVAVFRRSVRAAFRDIRGAVARLNGFLQEHLSGVRVVQLFDRERAVSQAFWQSSIRDTSRPTSAPSRSMPCSSRSSSSSHRRQSRSCCGTEVCARLEPDSPSACLPRSFSSCDDSFFRCRISPKSSTCCRVRWPVASGSSACSTRR